MPSRVALVTDSTSYLPSDLVERYGVRVVPLQVVVGGVPRAEDDISPEEVAQALREYVPVSTSRPAPTVLEEAYRAAAEEGAEAVVSVHLSGAMSGTYDAAVLAARDAPLPVHAVDSRALGMGLGFAVLAAAEAAEAGAPAERVAAVAVERARAGQILFSVDTLEHLRRGGRIGAAAALLGSALAVKPLLELREGRIVPLEKVRTQARAMSRLEELAVERAGDRAVDVAVHHLSARDRAEDLATRLRGRLPALDELRVVEVGAVVGAHVGPGMLAVVVSPR